MDEMSHERSWGKGKDRMDGGGPFVQSGASAQERGEMGNKRPGGLLLWQAIHSSSEVLEKGEAEIGEWRSEDGEMTVLRRQMICRHVL